MNRADIDWRYLGAHTLVPLVTTGVMLVVMASSGWFANAAEADYARISVDQDAVNANYDALIVRKRLVDRYHRRYERFREHGFIGEESRLDWIETLRLAANDLHLPNLTYSLEPQQPATPPVPSTSSESEIRIFVSQLDIEAGLIHERDLLTLVDELQAAAPGLIRINRCAMSRQSEPDMLQSVDPNVIASCSLDVYSIITSDVGGEAEL